MNKKDDICYSDGPSIELAKWLYADSQRKLFCLLAGSPLDVTLIWCCVAGLLDGAHRTLAARSGPLAAY